MKNNKIYPPFTDEEPKFDDQRRMVWLTNGEPISGSNYKYRAEGNINKLVWQVHKNVNILYDKINHLIASSDISINEINIIKEDIQTILGTIKEIEDKDKLQDESWDIIADELGSIKSDIINLNDDLNSLSDIIDNLDEYINSIVQDKDFLDDNDITNEMGDSTHLVVSQNLLTKSINEIQEIILNYSDVIESITDNQNKIGESINNLNGIVDDIREEISRHEEEIDDLFEQQYKNESAIILLEEDRDHIIDNLLQKFEIKDLHAFVDDTDNKPITPKAVKTYIEEINNQGSGEGDFIEREEFESSLNNKRDKDDSKFTNFLEVHAQSDSGTGIFLFDPNGNVRGQIIYSAMGVQISQISEKGDLQIFTFPTEGYGGEVVVKEHYNKLEEEVLDLRKEVQELKLLLEKNIDE